MPSSASPSVATTRAPRQHVGRAARHRDRLGARAARRRSAARPAPGRRSPSPSSPARPRRRCRRGWCRRGRSGWGRQVMRRLKSRSLHSAARPDATSARQPPSLVAESRRPMSQALHPCSTSPSRRRARAGAIINRASLDLDRLQVEHQGAERLRHRGRPGRRSGDHRHAARRLSRATASSPRSRAARAARATASTSGSSTRSTAPPTSSTACRPTRSRSRSAFRSQVQQAVVYDPARNDLFYASQGPRRLPQRQAPARLQAHAHGRRADRHRLSVPQGRRPRPLPAACSRR